MRDFDVSKSLRTDLAQETLEQLYEQNGRKISGLLSQNSRKNGFDIHTLRVSDKTGEAASGKKIEHASAVKISAEHGKYGLAHAVVRRSRSLSGRRFDPSAADAPRNDAHVCHLP